MRGTLLVGLLMLSSLCCCNLRAEDQVTGQDQPAAWRSAGTGQPYFDARQQQTRYVGPEARPLMAEDVAEVRIGYFGPADPDDPLAGSMWRAAQQAIDEANRAGGFQGKPFRLIPAWSADPWGTGVKRLTELVYRDRVWAIVGGIDGPTTHLAEQVVAKARLALISPVSTDKSVNLANVPWMFSLAPDDQRLAAALGPQIASQVQHQSWVLITGTDHDSYLLTRELRKALEQHHVTPRYQLEFAAGQAQHDHQIVQQTLAAHPVAVVLIAGPADSLRLVRALRAGGVDQVLYGGPGMARRLFTSQIGGAAGQLLVPLPAQLPVASTPAASQPSEGAPAPIAADYAALQTYDAVRLTIEAIQQAGLSRAAIARAVRACSPWQGRSGTVHWDGLGSNTRAVQMGTFSDGQLTALGNNP